MLKADWLQSQRQRRPAAVAVLLRRSEADPDGGASAARAAALLSAVRGAAAKRGAAVVAVVLSEQASGPAPPLPPAWQSALRAALGGGGEDEEEEDEDRLRSSSDIRVHCMSGPDAFPEVYGLPEASGGGGGGDNAATTATNPDDPLAAPARRQLREDALGPLSELVRSAARRYYARRAAKVSAKLAALSAAMAEGGGGGGASAALTLVPPVRLGEARIKLGTFAEMSADWRAAAAHYAAAHRALAAAAKVTFSPGGGGPHAHAQVARAAEVAHYKALTLLLHQSRPRDAREQARAHLDAFCRVPPPQAWPAGARAAHHAWRVRQLQVAMAMLSALSEEGGAGGAAAAAVHDEDDHDEDSNARRELSPGYLAVAAAEAALARRRDALMLPTTATSAAALSASELAMVRRGPYLGQLVLRTPLAAPAGAPAAATAQAICGSPLAAPAPFLAADRPATGGQQQPYVERPLTEDEYACWAAAEELRVASAPAAASGGGAQQQQQQQALDAVAAAAARLQQRWQQQQGGLAPDAAALAAAASAPRLVARLAAEATAASSSSAAISARRALVAAAYWARSEGWDAELLAALGSWREACATAASGNDNDDAPLADEAALCALEAAAVRGSGDGDAGGDAAAALTALCQQAAAGGAEFSVQHFDARQAQRRALSAAAPADGAAAASSSPPPLAASLADALLRHQQQHAGWLRVVSIAAGFATSPHAADATAASSPPQAPQHQHQRFAFTATLLNHLPVPLAVASAQVALSDARGAWEVALAPVGAAADGDGAVLPPASSSPRWLRFAAPIAPRCPGPLRAERLVLRLASSPSSSAPIIVSYLLPSFPPSASVAAAAPLLGGGGAVSPSVAAAVARAVGPGPLARLELGAESFYPQPGCFAVVSAVAVPSVGGAAAASAAAAAPPRLSWGGGPATTAAETAAPPPTRRALLGEYVPLNLHLDAPPDAPLALGEGAAVLEVVAGPAMTPPLVLLAAAAGADADGKLQSLPTDGGATFPIPASLPPGGRHSVRVWLSCPPQQGAAAGPQPAGPVAAVATTTVRVSAVLRSSASPSLPIASAPTLTLAFAPPFEHDVELHSEPGVHTLVAPGGDGAAVVAAGQTVLATVRVRPGPGLAAAAGDGLLELLDATIQPAHGFAALPIGGGPSLLPTGGAPVAFGSGAAASALSLLVPLRVLAPSSPQSTEATPPGLVSLGALALRWRRRRQAGASSPSAAPEDVTTTLLELPRVAAVRPSPLATVRVVAPTAPVDPGGDAFPLEVQVFNQQQQPVAAAASADAPATAACAAAAAASPAPLLPVLLELQPEAGLQPVSASEGQPAHLAYVMEVPPGEGRAARWALRALATGTGGVRVAGVPAVRVGIGAAGSGGEVVTQRLGLKVRELAPAPSG